MGHCDSSAQVRGGGAVRLSGSGVGAPAACAEREEVAAVSAQERELSDGSDGSACTRPSGSKSAPARALLMAVRIYQTFFSALMPSACKFYPSCSRYAAEAIEVHGARHGAWLALRRLGRCHPFTRGGVDLVPDAANEDDARLSPEVRP
jgi:putative membrane protein insertion efficiency factor